MVTVDGAPSKPAYRLEGGEKVRMTVPPPAPAGPAPQDLPLEIVFEDGDICVVNKPAGLVVHPAQGHENGTMVNALLHHIRDLSGVGGVMKPGIVHRLDKGTSGLMVVCKNDKSHTALQGQFAGREVGKKYLALVYGSPPAPSGEFNTAYGRNPGDRKKYSSKVTEGRRAVTRWRVVERYRGVSLVEADLLTGRTHQIRVHFADAGMPIVGDLQYGAARRSRQIADIRARRLVEKLDRALLHARDLSFTHPSTGKRMRFSAPPPPEIQEIIDALKGEK
jgi:23S rRNA pseudouridine1911/1915/1917 synthase